MFLFFATSAHAMAAGEGGGGNSIISYVLMIAIIFGIFYFMVIRPQKKQQEEHQKLLDEMEEGDRVVTAGGIHGKISSVQEDKVKLQVAKDFKLTLNKASISTVKGAEQEDGEAS